MVTPLSELTEQERAQAVERFHVLRPFLEEDISLLQIASQQQVSLRTLRRWIQRYHIEGLPGLIRKRRADRGERRRLPSYLQQLVEGLALQTPPLSIAVIHRKVCELAQQHDLKPPSYGLVYDIVRQLPTALTTLAHDGSKAYKQRFDLLHRREAQAPNEIWQADHCLLDILLVRDGQPPGQGDRIILTILPLLLPCLWYAAPNRTPLERSAPHACVNRHAFLHLRGPTD
jgi:putative transposase